MNLLESAGFSRSNPYYIVKQGKVVMCFFIETVFLDIDFPWMVFCIEANDFQFRALKYQIYLGIFCLFLQIALAV